MTLLFSYELHSFLYQDHLNYYFNHSTVEKPNKFKSGDLRDQSIASSANRTITESLL